MGALVDLLAEWHKHNLPLYALATIVSMAAVGTVTAALSNRVLAAAGATRGLGPAGAASGPGADGRPRADAPSAAGAAPVLGKGEL